LLLLFSPVIVVEIFNVCMLHFDNVLNENVGKIERKDAQHESKRKTFYIS